MAAALGSMMRGEMGRRGAFQRFLLHRSCKDMEARHSQAMVRRMVVDIMKVTLNCLV